MHETSTKLVSFIAVALPAVLVLIPACADGDGSGDGNGLEIVGSYDDGFGNHEITADTWTIADTAVFHIVEFDNAAGFLIANNDDDNEYAPGLWSRFEWVEDGDTLYYCQPVYDGETEDAARDAAGADPADLDMGCGGFPWSVLTPA